MPASYEQVHIRLVPIRALCELGRNPLEPPAEPSDIPREWRGAEIERCAECIEEGRGSGCQPSFTRKCFVGWYVEEASLPASRRPTARLPSTSASLRRFSRSKRLPPTTTATITATTDVLIIIRSLTAHSDRQCKMDFTHRIDHWHYLHTIATIAIMVTI